MRKIPRGSECANILVGQVDFLDEPVIAFARLAKPAILADLTEVSILLCFHFASEGQTRVSLPSKTNSILFRCQGVRKQCVVCLFLGCSRYFVFFVFRHQVALPTRFIFLVLGPPETTSIWEYEECGRAMAGLLTDAVSASKLKAYSHRRRIPIGFWCC